MAEKDEKAESTEIPVPPAPETPQYPRVDTAQVLPDAILPFIAQAAPEFAEAVDHKKDSKEEEPIAESAMEQEAVGESTPETVSDSEGTPESEKVATLESDLGVEEKSESKITPPVPPAPAPPAPTTQQEQAGSEQYVAQQGPVFVQAPTPPPARNNRLFGVLIGIPAALVFGALWVGILTLVSLFIDFGFEPLAFLVDAQLYIVVGAFYLGWVIWAVISNRAGKVSWAFGSIFVGLFAYAGYFLFLLLALEFNFSEFGDISQRFLVDFRPLFALIAAREIALWFGWIVSKRGEKVRKENEEALREYEKSIAEHPVVYPGLN